MCGWGGLLDLKNEKMWSLYLLSGQDSAPLCLCHCVCAKSLHSVLLFWDPVDCSPPGSPVHEDSPGERIGVGLPFSFPALTIIVLVKHPLETKSRYLPCCCCYFYLDV